MFDYRYSKSINSVVTFGKMSNNMTNWCLDFSFQVVAKRSLKPSMRNFVWRDRTPIQYLLFYVNNYKHADGVIL